MAVDILMSTYNGEKYLENQLLSLLMQRYKEWTLYIRDDGSTDNTLNIINKYTELDTRIKLVEKGINLGHGKSFMALLPYAQSDYVAFCDQDDIWFEDKLGHCVERAEQLNEQNTPLLICCQGYAYSDTQGTLLKGSIPKYQAKNLQGFLFLNGGYEGCLFLFNKSLLNIAKTYQAPFYGHDNVICLIAHSFGVVDFLPYSLMLYRQHNKNTSGARNSGWLATLKSFFRSNATVVTQVSYDQQLAFFKFFKQQLTTEQQRLFEQFFLYPTLSKMQCLKLVIKNGFKLGQHPCALILKTLFRRPI